MEMIMSTSTKKAALGAAAALIAAMGTVGAAEAHGMGKHRPFRNQLFVTSYDSCDYYKYKWFKSGKLFWKMKYFECLSYRSY
jgi:hypothetical protein